MAKFAGVHFLTIFVPLVGLGLMITAGYAWHNINRLSLPISGFKGLITGLLPFLSIVLVQYLRIDTSQNTRRRRGGSGGGSNITFQISDKLVVATILLLILDTVIITLSSTQLPSINPRANTCELDTQWQTFYRAKSPAIKQIQDALDCCGRHSVNDQYYPFPHGDSDINCVKTYPTRKNTPCFPSWQKQETLTSALLVVVAATSAAIKILAVAVLRFIKKPWIQAVLYRPWFGKQTEGTAYTRVSQVDDEEEGGRRASGNGDLAANRARGRGGEESDDEETFQYDEDARLRRNGSPRNTNGQQQQGLLAGTPREERLLLQHDEQGDRGANVHHGYGLMQPSAQTTAAVWES